MKKFAQSANASIVGGYVLPISDEILRIELSKHELTLEGLTSHKGFRLKLFRSEND